MWQASRCLTWWIANKGISEAKQHGLYLKSVPPMFHADRAAMAQPRILDRSVGDRNQRLFVAGVEVKAAYLL
jgi:hypothetical protein